MGFYCVVFNGDYILYCRSILFVDIGKTVLGIYSNQSEKIVIPYWKYALFCFPAVLAYHWKHGGIIPLGDFVSYVLFTPPVEHRIFDHLWFLSPYLLISLCLPMLFKSICKYRIPFIVYGACLILLLLFKQYYPELIQTAIV